MIRADLADLVFIYLFTFLSAVFFVWLSFEWKKQRRDKLALRNRLRCSMCGLSFEDASSEELPRCPRCGSMNERFRYREY